MVKKDIELQPNQISISKAEPKAGISTFLLKEKCFRSAPINEGFDGTYRVAAAIYPVRWWQHKVLQYSSCRVPQA